MFSLLLCFRSVIGRMSLAEGQERERAPERAGARAKSKSLEAEPRARAESNRMKRLKYKEN